ncbi:MAG: ASCH domain-containing protein [Planctomycetota bacterium]|jgi:hypothetical protein
MLFKSRFHAGLRDGSIDLTFRRWSRPQVKVGGVYRFDRGPGALVVDAVDRVAFGTVTAREAQRAGFDSVDQLRTALRARGAGVTVRTVVYRIAFHFDRSAVSAGATARAGADDVPRLVERLHRMDRLSRRGPWTRKVLALIAGHPKRRAGDLAPMVDRELRAFKADVRRLKGLGLTRSHEVGYELTSLGRSVLTAL